MWRFNILLTYQQLQKERDALAAQLAELKGQEPVAYSFRFAGCVTTSGPECWRNELERERPAQFLFDDGRVKDFQPLYARPVAPAQPVVPEGWGLVPEIMSDEMVSAFFETCDPRDCWQLLLAAAPQPESQEGSE